MDVNETKLANAAKAADLRPARDRGDRGRRDGARLRVADRRARHVRRRRRAGRPGRPNLVAGREPGRVPPAQRQRPGRDFVPDLVADLSNAREGDGCPTCGAPVILRNGIEVGNIFKLGTKYTAALGAEYLGEDGGRHPIVMGSLRDRRRAQRSPASSRRTTTRRGSPGPAEVAPYAAHLVSIGANEGPAGRRGRRAPRTSWRRDAGHEILWDDRDESPGVKFTDAELLGMPLDPDRQPALAGRRRRRGDRAGDRRPRGDAARGRPGLADRRRATAGALNRVRSGAASGPTCGPPRAAASRPRRAAESGRVRRPPNRPPGCPRGLLDRTRIGVRGTDSVCLRGLAVYRGGDPVGDRVRADSNRDRSSVVIGLRSGVAEVGVRPGSGWFVGVGQHLGRRPLRPAGDPIQALPGHRPGR